MNLNHLLMEITAKIDMAEKPILTADGVKFLNAPCHRIWRIL